MCWYTMNKNYMAARTADRDIEVYKIVVKDAVHDGHFLSVYTMFDYEPGKEYLCEIEIQDSDYKTFVTIDHGFHSYSKDMTYFMSYSQGGMKKVHVKSVRGDSNIDILLRNVPDALSTLVTFVMLVCEIPSGSTYYENEYGEIVSDRLRVKSAQDI